MKLTTILFSATLLFCSSTHAQSDTRPPSPAQPEALTSEPMTQSMMADIIKQLVEETQGSDNNLSFVYNDVVITMISDAAANRMRLVSAVVNASDMSDEQIIASLVSNYHLALDARYAIGNGVLFSTYIHPMAELTKAQLLSAVRQVATLSNTFGTSYTSGELSFAVQPPAEERIEI